MNRIDIFGLTSSAQLENRKTVKSIQETGIDIRVKDKITSFLYYDF